MQSHRAGRVGSRTWNGPCRSFIPGREGLQAPPYPASNNPQPLISSRRNITPRWFDSEPGWFMDSGAAQPGRGFTQPKCPFSRVPIPCRICDMDSGRGGSGGNIPRGCAVTRCPLDRGVPSDYSGPILAEVRSWIQGTSLGPRGLSGGFGARVSGSTHLRISAWPSANDSPPAPL